MPNLQSSLPSVRLRQHSAPVGPSDSEERRVGDINVGDHPVVNIAPQSDDARALKYDILRRFPLIKGNIELFCRRERVDVVGNLVAVGKTHAAADRHDGQFRNEAAPLLPDLEDTRGDARGTSRGPEGYHGTGQRIALVVNHRHRGSARPSRGRR